MMANREKDGVNTSDLSGHLDDQFRGLYPKLCYAYGFALAFILLWPFNFGFLHNNNVTWGQGAGGLMFDGGQAISPGPCKTLFDKILSGNGLSIELWISSRNLNQSGPARIITYSADPYQRNFMVGQEGNRLVIRLRTVNTDPDGVFPHAEVPNVFVSSKVRHLVVTYDFLEERIYVDGRLHLRQQAPVGGFENWDSRFPLVLGNEATGDRPWSGRIFYAAIYNKVMAEDTVSARYGMGWREAARENPEIGHDGNPVLRYCFMTTQTTTVHDNSGSSEPTDLQIPMVLYNRFKPILEIPDNLSVSSYYGIRDIVLNILAFIPIGFLFHAILRVRFGLSMRVTAAVLILCGLLTLGIESIQYFLPTRCSSMLDVIDNLAGAGLGVFADRFLAVRQAVREKIFSHFRRLYSG